MMASGGEYRSVDGFVMERPLIDVCLDGSGSDMAQAGEIAERWIKKYEHGRLRLLSELKRKLEEGE